VGAPANGHSWPWSIHRWIEGDVATPERMIDASAFAGALARFLVALEAIDCAGGPVPGPGNFHRGGSLRVYDGETRRAIAALGDRIDADRARAVWDVALRTKSVCELANSRPASPIR
jgi:aminoglycoside phosphotransferase (APT) family kinase protein